MNKKDNIQIYDQKRDFDPNISTDTSTGSQGIIVEYAKTTYVHPVITSQELWELNEKISIIGERIDNIENDIKYIKKTSGYEQYLVVSINDVFIKDKKVRLSKDISLIVQFENGQYIVSYNNLGLLAVNDSLDGAIDEIQKEFSGLWDDYVLCLEEELTMDGLKFKNKLKEYVNDIV